METDDQTLEGGVEETIDLELEPTEPDDGANEDTTDEEGSTGDPLDDIRDETARAEAKKARAIARRKAQKPEDKVEETQSKPVDSSQFMTKAEFEKSNERKAILSVTKDEEVKEHWEEIRQFYTPRRGKATPEDIQEDIKDAITLFKARSTPEVEDPAAELQTTTAPTGTASGPKTKEIKAANLPGFSESAKPDSWFPKK